MIPLIIFQFQKKILSKKNIPLSFLFFLNSLNLFANNYYLSQSGKDSDSGLSVKTAWRSISRLNKTQLQAGDKVFFEGNSVFDGTILLEENNFIKQNKQIIIGSFGKGKATINAGASNGILVHNIGNVTIENLIFKGDGVNKNNGNGVEFLVDKPNLNLRNISVTNCISTGFHKYGILINGENSDKCGFENVKIINCIASENGEAGIGSLAFYPTIAHENIVVKNCRAFNNRGIITKTENHSGNGIVLSGVKNCKIEKCEAYENGEDNRSKSGGPVGIWLWNCTNGIIENCESHHNHAGLLTDGGGFDLDGGCNNCVIQNCNSHNNEGAGYLLCEFGSPLKFANNTLKNNRSTNDGLKNGYGGITFCGAGEEFLLINSKIIGNKIIVSAKKVVDKTPAALCFINNDFDGIEFKNNQIEVTEKGNLMNIEKSFIGKNIIFKENFYKFEKTRNQIFCKNCVDFEKDEILKILK